MTSTRGVIANPHDVMLWTARNCNCLEQSDRLPAADQEKCGRRGQYPLPFATLKLEKISLHFYTVSKKTSPTFLAITRESIGGFL